MTPATHPDPAAVLAWYEGDIDGCGLLGRLAALRRDPDWRVQAILGHTRWDIDLIHWPTRAKYAVRLEPVPGSDEAVWRRAA